MNLQQWRENAGLTRKQVADNLSKMLRRKITANHVGAWEKGSMPAWDSGEAISMLTGGKVKPDSFVKAPAAPA
jgi:transcriptional regulator with XRE-family HTH domain